MKKGIPSFRFQLITMTMVTCICSVLVLGITLILIFVHTFSENARNDVKFYLKNTTEQFDLRLLYLEDILTDLRHNIDFQDFYEGTAYDRQIVEKQLSHSSDLFSSRNMVDSSYPFIESIYLFNNHGDLVSNNFYPNTLSALSKKDSEFREIDRDFRRTDREFAYFAEGDGINLCMWIYDENMEMAGSCAVSLGKTALEKIFGGVEQYDGSFWMVSGADGKLLAANQKGKSLESYAGIDEGEETIGGTVYLLSRKNSGFGLSSLVGAPGYTVYDSVRSTIFLFAAIFILVLAIVAASVFFISYSYTKPLKTVADKIKRFGGGNFDTRLEVFENQEFNDISVVFNEMAQQINFLITQVYEKQLLATQSQVRFLQSQINPHFMFNVLSMISMRAGLGGNTEVQKLLTAFSKLLQGKIFRSGEILIPLSEELELVDFYLYLQSNRFSGKINYEITCEKGLEVIKIPRLSVEPLVENAVSHGLEPKEGSGNIRVSISKQEEKLRILVEDDGEGFDVEAWRRQCGQEKREDGRHTRIGIVNTEKLLRIFYKEEALIDIQSSPGKGTCVTVVLPVVPEEEKSICGVL